MVRLGGWPGQQDGCPGPDQRRRPHGGPARHPCRSIISIA